MQEPVVVRLILLLESEAASILSHHHDGINMSRMGSIINIPVETRKSPQDLNCTHRNTETIQDLLVSCCYKKQDKGEKPFKKGEEV